jgi:hypothetical protein
MTNNLLRATMPRDDLAALGDSATAALVQQAIDRFFAWKYEAGDELLERALEERHRHCRFYCGYTRSRYA